MNVFFWSATPISHDRQLIGDQQKGTLDTGVIRLGDHAVVLVFADVTVLIEAPHTDERFVNGLWPALETLATLPVDNGQLDGTHDLAYRALCAGREEVINGTQVRVRVISPRPLKGAQAFYIAWYAEMVRHYRRAA